MSKYKVLTKQEIEVSTCCEWDVRYNGFVGLIDYGYTCNRCDRKCNTKKVVKEIWQYKK